MDRGMLENGGGLVNTFWNKTMSNAAQNPWKRFVFATDQIIFKFCYRICQIPVSMVIKINGLLLAANSASYYFDLYDLKDWLMLENYIPFHIGTLLNSVSWH